MKSRWNDTAAARCPDELALRAYSSRLLGGDASMVLHGGGNTSIKLNENDAAVLYVKGTGSDLARVDASSFTPLRLDGVQTVLGESDLNNAAMMQALDACLARRPAPRPSIETLLHGGLPFRCVEHTHADAVLAAMNVDAIQHVHAEVYGDRAPLVPYRHSGHALARACMEAFNARRTGNTIGLILAFHGVVAFGDDVRSSYENMLELVTRAEDYLRARGAWDVAQAPLTPPPAATQALAELHEQVNATAGASLVMQIATDTQCMTFVRRADLADISQQGPATPQHAVYTKRVPMIGRDVQAFAAAYRDYLDAHLGKAASALMDAAPRIVLDPDVGVIAFGTTAREAQMALEMYQHDIAIITRASAHGRYCAASPAAMALAEFDYGGYAAKPSQQVNGLKKI